MWGNKVQVWDIRGQVVIERKGVVRGANCGTESIG